MSSPHRTHPARALCAYAEPLVEGRRVVVVGDSSLDLGAILVESGARVVHVYDPSPERARASAAQAPARGVVVRELPREGFDVRDGAFDLALVPDLAAVHDAPALLARVRRLLAADGALLVAAGNPAAKPRAGHAEHGAIDYAELYDMVAMQFASVRMIGQVPFVGVTLAELGETDEEPEVSVDTQLGPEDRTPAQFIALASQADVRLAPYALIELDGEPAGVAPRDVEAERALRSQLAEATLRAELLAAQLDEARGAAQRAATDAEGARTRRIADLEAHARAVEARALEQAQRAERMEQESAALEAEVGRLRRRAVELEEQTADYKRMRAHSEVELSAARAGIADLEERVAVLSSELDAVSAAVDVPEVDPEAIAALAERAARGEEAQGIVRQLEADLANAGELHGEELAQIEALLRERAQAIQELEMELLRRERLVKELVRALEEAQHGHPAPAPTVDTAAAAELDIARRENRALRERLDALALEAARREADVQSQAWRVAELEEKLRMASLAPAAPAAGPAVSGGDTERNLAQARAELDALRQALTQEHDARARVESGEALAKAQAELARQAALIEQLSRELDARDRRREAQA